MALVVAVAVYPPASTADAVAHDLPSGEWMGTVHRDDGVVSQWQLHLWHGTAGLNGDLYFGAG